MNSQEMLNNTFSNIFKIIIFDDLERKNDFNGGHATSTVQLKQYKLIFRLIQ